MLDRILKRIGNSYYVIIPMVIIVVVSFLLIRGIIPALIKYRKKSTG
ncbi:MAG: hypothetical protein AB7P13_14065 [Candidatus Nitrosocosmicus sp.]